MVGVDVMKHVLEDLEDKAHEGMVDTATVLEGVFSVQSCLNEIANTNAFMIMMINRCIDYTKASKGFRLVPKYETINLQDSMKMPLQCMRNIQSKILITLNSIPPNIDSYIISDKQWLQENMLCLLSNAAKYSQEGYVTISIALETKEEQEEAIVTTRLPASTSIASTYSAARSKLFSNNAVQPIKSELSFSLSRSSGGDSGHDSRMSFSKRSEDVSIVHDITCTSDNIDNSESLFIRFEVEDTGIGVPDNLVASLFSPFKQTQRLAGGTGLGLFSLAKRIEALGGKYGVRHRRDGLQGSLFWFSFPYRPDKTINLNSNNGLYPKSEMVMPVPTVESSGLPTDFERQIEREVVGEEMDVTTSVSHRSNVSGNLVPLNRSNYSLNILIVDDSPPILKMTSMMLSRRGHLVTVAENGAIALKMFEEIVLNPNQNIKKPFDLVLMDLQMPVMDGIEAVRRIRELENQSMIETNCTSSLDAKPKWNKRLVIIGISACSDHETIAAAYDSGINGFMAKPFNQQTFEKTVTELVFEENTNQK